MTTSDDAKVIAEIQARHDAVERIVQGRDLAVTPAHNDRATLLRLLQSRASTREEALEEAAKAIDQLYDKEVEDMRDWPHGPAHDEGKHRSEAFAFARRVIRGLKSSPAPSPITKTEG